MITASPVRGRNLAFVRRCRRCGVNLALLPSYNTQKTPWARYLGEFCIDCALGLIPEVVALTDGSRVAYGTDFKRYDVRCGRCGLVGEFGCRVS